RHGPSMSEMTPIVSASIHTVHRIWFRNPPTSCIFFFSSRRRHTRSLSAFLLNRSSDLYFKAPWMPDRTEANPNELNQDDARYGFRCCHLKNIWTAPLPPETELSRQMTTSTTSIDIMGLQAAYANLHTDQE